MLRIFILLVIIASKSLGNYQIIFDKEYSPPQRIPLVDNMYYSVPLNQQISKPIIAYFVDPTGRRIMDGPLSHTVVQFFTMSVNTAANENVTDEWKKSGGTLCQTIVMPDHYPEKMEISKAITKCGTHPDKTALSAKSTQGRIIIDGIFHRHSTLPKHPRIIRIVCTSPKITADTYPFLITNPADHLVLQKLPPSNVLANHPFQLTAIITDRNGMPLTRGLDSIAYVNLLVPYYYKTFFHPVDKNIALKHSLVRLTVDNIAYMQNGDQVIRKRASKGFVYFNGIRILDTVSNLQLNLTMTMARFPWTRIPNCPVCYDDVKNVTFRRRKTEITFPNLGNEFYKKIKPMLLTRPMNILTQTASYLKVANHTLQEWKKWIDPKINAIRIARNIPIPGKFTVYLFDKDAERIYSGPDADLTLSYTTIPPGVCVSRDATRRLYGGWANLFVSICQLITKVKLIVSIVNKTAITVATPDFRVEGILHVAHLANFKSTFEGLRFESGITNFISSAISEINQGIVMNSLARAGFKFKLISVNSGNTVGEALEASYNLTEFASNTFTPLQGIISSLTEHTTFTLNPELISSKVPYISIVNTGKALSDESEYPYVNRVCWSETFILQALISLLHRHNWMTIIIVREAGISLSRIFRNRLKVSRISVEREFIFPKPHLDSTSSDYYFPFQMTAMAKCHSRVIFLFANNKMQGYILRDAYRNHLDTEHGYQWIITGSYIWEFPFQDEGPCATGPKTCADTFKGTLLIGETYNVDTNSERWIRVLDRNFATDRYARPKGLVEFQSAVISAKQALGYDALMVLAYAVNNIVSRGLSVTGYLINKNIRNTVIMGLTGAIKINSYGERFGYQGFLAQICPVVNGFCFLRLMMLKYSTIIEIPFEIGPSNVSSFTEVILPTSTQYNIRKYPSITGMVSLDTLRVILNPKERWPSSRIFRTEMVIPAYTCNRSCGFKQTNESDINVYDTGKCVDKGKCECEPGYTGRDCRILSCYSCIHGTCISPDVCKCDPGWKGSSCNTAHCESCIDGICNSPGKCTCFLYAMGKHCSLRVAAVVLPIVAVVVILLALYLSMKVYLGHRRQKSALTNTDWIVDPSSIEWCQPEHNGLSRTSFLKRSTTLMSPRIMETYMWKNEKWYAIRLRNFSIDSDDVSVRLEMAELVKIKHPNLVRYGGACLVYPNVCLFAEVAHRGSLHDVLRVSTLNLGMDFRFSFMKDICSGMRYLHEETHIGSHGRLTSFNCLLFSYWTIKISGFGVPSIRYGKYRQPKEEHAEDLRKLLWTAPELLNKNIKCLDEVRNGNKTGDIYSFAIIISEILTQEDPFEYELEYISERALLDLIIDPFDCANDSARSKWKEIGGVNMLSIRPILRDENLAHTVLHLKMVRRILAEAWDKVPSSRPSFKKLYLMLEECYPASGCLMDNLINLISSYSTNLERIVLERTAEINESKEKSEQLLRQLLPCNIAEELKKGRKVTPELFECVTVFFSDIVNMAEIIVESTPSQIVEFLHDIHNAFQGIIVKYNVYKVDMICDTCIIVSGLPERIGLQHAGEIATMSLHLLSLVTEFKIKHRLNEALQIRIGIHSGSVVAGIVGTMMPKYCVFGDTVNTASRMQSSSIAHRIQVSDATAKILGELGGYDLVSRGMREVKGRGLMCTYWLHGKTGFHYALPDGSRAISLSHHRFK